MEDRYAEYFKKSWNLIPGGMANIALDDALTILYATDNFYSLIKGVVGSVKNNALVSLHKMVYSADIIYLTQQLAVQKRRTDSKINLQFRSLQPDGSFKWVMISGTKTSEMYKSGHKEVPVYACIAMDATDHMKEYKRLEQVEDYHRITSELAKDLFFEYEIANDTLIFGEVFREVFGKDSVITSFRKRLEKTKIVHVDELKAVNQIFNSIMRGRKQVRFEVRLLPKDVLTTYTCYASIIYDENRNPHKVVGKLSANPERKEVEAEKVKPVPSYDGLTHVYTKSYAEEAIISALKEQEQETFGALILMEVRNYKQINQIVTAMGRENVLASIAGLIKGRCRNSDIVGRIGLSEYIVYLKDIPSDRLIYEIANKICKEVDLLYPYDHVQNRLSISMGVTFCKGNQQDFNGLVANASTALVMAKKVNTSSFEVIYVGNDQ